jgi:lysozyme
VPQFDGKRVSRPWYRILNEARAHGVRFLLTSGRRTMAEQAALFHQNMQLVGGRWVRKPGRPLTAWPSPTAPHIRVGRIDHALDVNALDGGENRLQAWLRDHDVISTNPVPGEPWHLEAPAGDLDRLSDRIQREHQQERDRYQRLNARKPAGERKVSDEGIALIANYEGFVPYAYNDAAGHATVGYGRLLHTGPVNAADRQEYGTKSNPKVTKPQALKWLREDVSDAAGTVRSVVKVPVRQQEFDALVSLTYNIGGGAFGSSTLLRELNAGHYRRAANQFLRWNRAGGQVLLGLSRRRQAERKLFKSKRD